MNLSTSTCKLLIVAGLLFGGGVAGAQPFNVKFGAYETKTGYSEILQIVPHGEEEFYLVRVSEKRREVLNVEKYNAESLERISLSWVEIVAPDGQAAILERILSTSEGLHIFYSVIDKKSKRSMLWMKRIRHTTQESDPAVLLVETDNPSKKGSSSFKVIAVKSGDHFAVLEQRPDLLGTDHLAELFVFLPSGELHWKKIFISPVPELQGSINNVLIDTKGHAILLVSFAVKGLEDAIKTKRFGKKYWLISFNQDNNRLRELELSLGQKWVYDALLQFSPEDDIVVTGLYSSYAELAVGGVFTLTFDNYGEMKAQGLKPFEKDFTEQFKYVQSGMETTELDSYMLSTAFLLPSDNAMMIAERQYVRTTSYFNPHTGMQSLMYEYHFDSFLVTLISPSGQVVWATRSPKFQTNTRTQCAYCSYLPALWNNNAAVLYNDHPRNFPLSGRSEDRYRTLEGTNQIEPVLLWVTEAGTMQKYRLYNGEELDLIFIPGKSIQLPNGNALLVCESNSAHMLVSVRFDSDNK